MIKPEFWSSQSLHRVSLEARLLFIGIWNFSDDFGVCLDSNRKILGEIFPNDEQITERKIQKWKQELINETLLLPVVHNAANYLIIRSWSEHQKVDHPSGRRWLANEIIEELSTKYLSSREGLATNSRSKEERGKKKEESEKTKYGDSVFLSNEEYSSLLIRLDEKDSRVKRCIEILDNYKGASGKTYKSDYKAILSWVIGELEKREQTGGKKTKPTNGAGDINAGFQTQRILREKEEQKKSKAQ